MLHKKENTKIDGAIKVSVRYDVLEFLDQILFYFKLLLKSSSLLRMSILFFSFDP